MILDSQERIKEYTKGKDGWESGWWGEVTINDLIKRNAEKYPDREALVDPENKPDLVGLQPKRYVWGEIDRIIDRLALSFVDLGIKPDDIVMAQLPNISELALIYPALSRIGAIASSIPVQWRAHEIRYLLELTEAKAFITMPIFKEYNHIQMIKDLSPAFPQLKHIIGVGKDVPEGVSSFKEMIGTKIEEKYPNNYLDEHFKITANDIIAINWTSGTVTVPKGCSRTHNNSLAGAAMCTQAGRLEEGEVFHTVFPLVNVANFIVYYVPWIILAGKYVMHHPFDAALYLKQIQDEKVTFSGAAPAIHTWILKNPDIVGKYDLSSLKVMMSGSAPLGVWACKDYKEKFGVEVENIWGMNEGVGLISNPVDTPDPEARASFYPQWGKKGVKWAMPFTEAVKTKLIDPATRNEVTEVGQQGELYQKSPFLMPGYFKRHDLTERAFDKEGYLATGDLFTIQENNFISFTGRVKDLIIRGGVNIAPEEIEDLVEGHPKVLEAAAVGMPDPTMGEEICIYVVPQKGETITLDEIVLFLQEKGIAKYKLPKRMEIIKVLPRTALGKKIKADLREDIKLKLAG